MKKFNIIRGRRIERLKHFADIVRPDLSRSDLEKWKMDGYTQVYFLKNVSEEDATCTNLDGNVYNIDDLLTYDNPLFRTSHPNCMCQFMPLEESRQSQEGPQTEENLQGIQ